MSQYYVIRNDTPSDELYHYGVKGMRWGHRKAVRPQLSTSKIRGKYDSAKADYKSAKKDYSRSFDDAYNKSFMAYSPSKKHRQDNDKRWEEAANKAETLRVKKQEYKQAKAERKQAIKDAYKDMQEKTSFGEKLVYSDGTRRKAAKYVVDNDMTVAEASKRAKTDAWRNTAAFVGAYGAIAVASLYLNK